MRKNIRRHYPWTQTSARQSKHKLGKSYSQCSTMFSAKIASSPLEHPQNQPIFTKHGLACGAWLFKKNTLLESGRFDRKQTLPVPSGVWHFSKDLISAKRFFWSGGLRGCAKPRKTLPLAREKDRVASFESKKKRPFLRDDRNTRPLQFLGRPLGLARWRPTVHLPARRDGCLRRREEVALAREPQARPHAPRLHNPPPLLL
jgi:hypothetical protein